MKVKVHIATGIVAGSVAGATMVVAYSTTWSLLVLATFVVAALEAFQRPETTWSRDLSDEVRWHPYTRPMTAGEKKRQLFCRAFLAAGIITFFLLGAGIVAWEQVVFTYFQ